MQPSNSGRIPYSMTPEYGEQRFNDVYNKALQRKKLFKEYISRHQVLEKMNMAIEELFESDQLPDNPMDFIAKYLTTPGGIKANSMPQAAPSGRNNVVSSRPSSRNESVNPSAESINTNAATTANATPTSGRASPSASTNDRRTQSPIPTQSGGLFPGAAPSSIAAKVSPRPMSARPTSATRQRSSSSRPGSASRR